ncbi:MAG: hypothetical protein WKF36_07475 [Candidatus Nitrosocosmicus sp.]
MNAGPIDNNNDYNEWFHRFFDFGEMRSRICRKGGGKKRNHKVNTP